MSGYLGVSYIFYLAVLVKLSIRKGGGDKIDALEIGLNASSGIVSKIRFCSGKRYDSNGQARSPTPAAI